MTTMKRRTLRLAVACGLLGTASSVFALDGVVGPDNCDEAGLTDVLGSVDASGGGTVTFDCGTATIVFSTWKTIDHAVVIDGGGTITFDGGGASLLLRINDTGDVTLRGLTLTHSPGAIYSTGSLTLSDDTVTENSGSPVNSRAALHVLRSVFSGNVSNISSGGAIQSSVGPLLIEDSVFDSNTSNDSGAVFIDAQTSDARIDRSVFTSNGANNAGAIGTWAPTTVVRGSRFENNHADFHSGGAIWAAGGMLTVEDSSFVGNSATQTFGAGGAIDCLTGTLQISGSTFSGNEAGLNGGGAIRNACALEVTNVTMTGNSTQGAGGAIAIYSSASLESSIAFATIDANSATLGAGIFNGGSVPAPLHVGRSIVSANGDSNCGGSMIVSDGYNLSDDDACATSFTAPGDVLDANLPLQPLDDYGGPTPTQPPAEDNAAIDHVPASVCAPFVDQRGAPRPFGAGCDAGAVEAGSPPGDTIFRDGFDG